jgi:hypothetical protein
MTHTRFTCVELAKFGATFTGGIHIEPTGVCPIVAGKLVQSSVQFANVKVTVEGSRWIVRMIKDTGRGYELVTVLERYSSFFGTNWYQYLPEEVEGPRPPRISAFSSMLFTLWGIFLILLTFIMPGLFFLTLQGAEIAFRKAKGENGILYEEDLP